MRFGSYNFQDTKVPNIAKGFYVVYTLPYLAHSGGIMIDGWNMIEELQVHICNTLQWIIGFAFWDGFWNEPKFDLGQGNQLELA